MSRHYLSGAIYSENACIDNENQGAYTYKVHEIRKFVALR